MKKTRKKRKKYSQFDIMQAVSLSCQVQVQSGWFVATRQGTLVTTQLSIYAVSSLFIPSPPTLHFPLPTFSAP